nr:MAG TPA: hypothetical protein [Caudoviricetes sp.]DAV83318.1 MAG TPA: hypothetical protein [Caudoviricetes sp.]DAY93383.1 MAG TPA: hypothetical protein [Caudoviricetes sp.]
MYFNIFHYLLFTTLYIMYPFHVKRNIIIKSDIFY